MSESYSFVLRGKALHKLNQNSFQKEYVIQIGDIQYLFSRLQIAFLSLNALFHFEETNQPFILFPSESIQISDLNSAFLSLIALFEDQTGLIIYEKNIKVMTFLAEVLDNPLLLFKCYDFTPSFPQSFRFSSTNLLFIPQIKRNLLNDFKVIFNGKTFEVNYSLFCCCADKLNEMNSNQSEMKFEIPNEHFHCFDSFLNLFQGKSFHFQNYSFDSLSYLIQFFGLSCLFESISSSFSKPNGVIGSINFVSIPHCELYDEHSKKIYCF
jgi:hypothetical protein